MPCEQTFLAEQWFPFWTVFVNQDDRLHPRSWSVPSLFYPDATWPICTLLIRLLSKVLSFVSTNSSTKTSTETIQSLSNETLQPNSMLSWFNPSLSAHRDDVDTRFFACHLCELFHDSLGHRAMCKILEENDQSLEDEIQSIESSVHIVVGREISEERRVDGRHIEYEERTVTHLELRRWRWRLRRYWGWRGSR